MNQQNTIRTVDLAGIKQLSQDARESPRKRAHLLLHGGHDDQVQRLLIVLQPGSYVRPHRHSEQWEMLVLLQGSADLLQFRETGELTGRVELFPACPVAQIPIGAWHGFFVRAPDTAVMEIKPGPYRPNEFADWAPPEGDASVPAFLERLR